MSKISTRWLFQRGRVLRLCGTILLLTFLLQVTVTYLPHVNVQPVIIKIYPDTAYVENLDHLPPEYNLTDRYIIFRCNTSSLCGGLADRQKGIVSAYVLSQMLRRKFGIVMTKGCLFSKYVIPNQIDWLLENDDLQDKSSTTFRRYDDVKIGTRLINLDLDSRFRGDVVYYEANVDYVPFFMKNSLFKTIKWAEGKSHYDIYRIAFNQLFRFSASTLLRYKDFQAKVKDDPLTCVHLRMGKSAKWKDQNLAFKRPNLDVVIEFLKKNVTGFRRLFVATDSVDVRSTLQETFPESFIDLEGKILHIDKSGLSFQCAGFQKAIIDQYILTKCHTLLVSHSGFSRVAAVLRGRKDNLYQAYKDDITVPEEIDPTPVDELYPPGIARWPVL